MDAAHITEDEKRQARRAFYKPLKESNAAADEFISSKAHALVFPFKRGAMHAAADHNFCRRL